MSYFNRAYCGNGKGEACARQPVVELMGRDTKCADRMCLIGIRRIVMAESMGKQAQLRGEQQRDGASS